MHRQIAFLVASLAAATAAHSQQPSAPRPFIEVELARPLLGQRDAPAPEGPFSGRLVIQLAPIAALDDVLAFPADAPSPAEADLARLNNRMSFTFAAAKPFPGLVAAAMDVENLRRGDVIQVDANKLATTGPLSSLPPGEYAALVSLDVDGDFAATGRTSNGDLLSSVQKIRIGEPGARLTLTTRSRVGDWPQPMPQMNAVRLETEDFDFVSPSLSAFHGKPTHIRGYVLLPPRYAGGSETYPLAFDFAPFGTTFDMLPVSHILQRHAPMYEGQASPMLWVFLDPADGSVPLSFVDSANTGPWAKAIAEELTPWLEGQYRADARPSGRLLVGDGDGGRAALWLLAKYPKLFGGAWVKSPDAVDFRSLLGTDIYASRANLFVDSKGAAKTIRDLNRRPLGGHVSYEDYALRNISGHETVYGSTGRLASLERAFSPKGADGKPQPLFDRATGAIDPTVARYWGEHGDLARYIAANGSTLKADLDGKIHITVGAADALKRNEAVTWLKDTLDRLGVKSDIAVPLGRDERTLSVTDIGGRYATSMNRVARPDSTWTAPDRSRNTGRGTTVAPPKPPAAN